MNDEEKQYVLNIYTDPRRPQAFGNLERLFKLIKDDGRYDIDKVELESFMREQEIYTSHLTPKKTKFFAKVIAPYPNYGIEIDSAVMPFKQRNRLKYMIVGKDIFSRKVAARAVVSLKSDNVVRAVRQIIDELGGHYEQARTDRGTEYLSGPMQRLFKENGIRHVLGFEPLKAPFAEGVIKIIKNKIYKIMQFYGNENWNRFLQDVVHSLNSKQLKALDNLSPDQVTPEQVPRLWRFMTQNDLKSQPEIRDFKYNIGDTVRIHYSRGAAFKKAYNETMGAHVYYIEERFAPGQVHLYRIRDERDVIQPGRFRETELEKVIITDQTVWRIDKIVGRQMRNGVKYVKVRFLDYPEPFDQWMKATDVQNLKAKTPRRNVDNN